MPDWSYQPFLRPALFCLRPETGRSVATGAMGLMQRSAPTRAIFHAMSPRFVEDPIDRLGVRFPTRIGLGPGVDQNLRALRLWPMLGFGFIHAGYFGPPPNTAKSPERHRRQYAISWTEDDVSLPIDALRSRMAGATGVPVIGWLSARAQHVHAARLAEITDVLSVPHDRTDICRETGRPVIVRVPLDRARDAALGDADGFLLTPPTPTDSPDLTDETIGAIAAMRTRAPSAVIIAGAGMLIPEDAARAIDAGADLVEVNTGLVYSGPGIAHRMQTRILAS